MSQQHKVPPSSEAHRTQAVPVQQRPSTAGAASTQHPSAVQSNRLSTSYDDQLQNVFILHDRGTSARGATPPVTSTSSAPNSRPTSASSTGSGSGPVVAPASQTSNALTAALAAAAASTSASLFNLTELFDTVKMMSCGRVFTGYFANQSLMEPIKQDLFVFFDCSPPPNPGGKKPPPGTQALERPPQMQLGGALYWSVVGRDGSLHRTKAADLSLALSEIDDIYLGKRTNAFTLPFASNAREECCFSLIAKNRTHMNFEAKNPVLLVSWLFGLKRLVQANKKILEPTLPPASSTSHSLTSGALDIHDTNQTSLKQDIWHAILQGIQAGVTLFAQQQQQQQGQGKTAPAQAQGPPQQINQQQPHAQPQHSAGSQANPQPQQQKPGAPAMNTQAPPSNQPAAITPRAQQSATQPASQAANSDANAKASSTNGSNSNGNTNNSSSKTGGFLANLLKKNTNNTAPSTSSTPSTTSSSQSVESRTPLKPAPAASPSAAAGKTSQSTAITQPTPSSLNTQRLSVSGVPSANKALNRSPGGSFAGGSNPNSLGGPNSFPSPSIAIDDSIDPLQLFQILGRIGQGNFGYVYKARDTRDDSLVAIKILEVDSAASCKELEAEISILAKCQSKYIVSYKGTFLRGNQIWIIMEYCLAGSVCDLMAITDRILNETAIAAILSMCLQGLAYFHSLKHLHRDIKAGNILLNHDGVVKLSDFGVSAQLTASISKRKTLLGSPYWMAPEVLTSSNVSSYNEKADIWSLGATAIELATGDPPFHDIHPMKAIFAIPTLPPPRLPVTYPDGTPCTWSSQFMDFVAACLCKDPNARPSALQLQSHPFVRGALTTAASLMKQLVIECMPEIDKYREIEARMANKVAFGSRGRGGGGDSDSEHSVSRSMSSISRSHDYSYATSNNMRNARSISDLRNLASSRLGLNQRTARWEKELSRSERDRDRTRREREWELELSARRDVEYSQRSHSPSFSTSEIGGAYWADGAREEMTPVKARDGHSLSLSIQAPPGGSGGKFPTAGPGRMSFQDTGEHSPPSARRSISRSTGGSALRTRGSAGSNILTPNRSFDERDERDALDLDMYEVYEGAEREARALANDASPSFNTLYLHATQSRADSSLRSSTNPGGGLAKTRPSSATTPPQDHLEPRTPVAAEEEEEEVSLPAAARTATGEDTRSIFTPATTISVMKDGKVSVKGLETTSAAAATASATNGGSPNATLRPPRRLHGSHRSTGSTDSTCSDGLNFHPSSSQGQSTSDSPLYSSLDSEEFERSMEEANAAAGTASTNAGSTTPRAEAAESGQVRTQKQRKKRLKPTESQPAAMQ